MIDFFSFFFFFFFLLHYLDSDWAIAQAEHSANYKGTIATLYTGGLNLQIEHHLFPAMAYRHYTAISKIVEQECKAFKVQYTSFDTLPAIIGSFVSYMKVVGSAKGELKGKKK